MLSPKRLAGAGAFVAAAALSLSACGTDNNSASSSSSAPKPAASQCANGTLTASGSTAQQNAMSSWIKAFQGACSGANINYQGNGSGAGVQQFIQNQVAFAGSDFPLDAAQKPQADQRCGSGNQAIDLPMVPGPIALAYNLPGVSNLKLSAATLAGIFSGKITTWNAPQITQENPGVNLPSTGIQSFHRSDGSGTTFNFTNYLENDAKGAWTFGHDKTWKAPGGQGAKGSAGVAQGVKSTAGGIGYMEQSFATQNGLPFAEIGNARGQFVSLTTQNTVNFLSEAQPAAAGSDLALKFNYASTNPNAYPAVLVTYEIVCKAGNNPSTIPLLKNFMTYVAGPGQQLLPQNGYVALPTNLQTQVQAAVNQLS